MPAVDCAVAVAGTPSSPRPRSISSFEPHDRKRSKAHRLPPREPSMVASPPRLDAAGGIASWCRASPGPCPAIVAGEVILIETGVQIP